MDTVTIPKGEYMELKRENTLLRRELGYLRDGTIPKLLKKLDSVREHESRGEIYTLKDIDN